jgi:hypothetical protein
MKNKLLTKICITGCFCIIFACHEKVNEQDYIVIDLENTANNKGFDGLTLNDISSNIRIIPTETNDSVLFSSIRITGESKESLITHTRDAVYSINKKTGKVSCLLKKQGQGPGEYSNVFDVTVDESNKVLYVYSTAPKTNMYDFSGNFIKSIKNDSIGMFAILPDGNFAVSYPPWNASYALGIYDTSWNLKRTSIPRKRKNQSDAFSVYSDVFKFNNEYFYSDARADTLYKITSESEKPYIIIHKGKYKMPDEVFDDFSRYKQEGPDYITSDWGLLVGRYFFVSYNHYQKTFYEIWDIANSKQIYKREYSENEPKVNGIPVSIGDVTIATWPRYVSGNTMYCVVEVDDALKLIPTLPEDTNPIILEIEIKNSLK